MKGTNQKAYWGFGCEREWVYHVLDLYISAKHTRRCRYRGEAKLTYDSSLRAFDNLSKIRVAD